MPKIRTGRNYTHNELFIGVDPGLSGGVAFLSGKLSRDYVGDSSAPDIVFLGAMPATEKDVWDLFASTLVLPASERKCTALIEWINPGYVGTNKSSMSKLYGSYAGLRMALCGNGIRFDDVKPAKWQRGLGIPVRKKSWSTTVWKNTLKSKAQQLFPDVHITLKTADALLIAEYCRRTQQ